MRAIGRELTLLTGVEQHLSLKIQSRESEEYSAFLAAIVMDKEYHLQYYNLLRLLFHYYGCIMTSYSVCLKQLDTAELSLYTFFSKQLLLFDVFRRVDVSIYQKYTIRFSSLLWNLCVTLISKKESNPVVYSIAASSLLMALTACESKSSAKSCEFDAILDRLFSVSTSSYSKNRAFFPLSRVYQSIHSTFPHLIPSTDPTREFRFYFYWSRLEASLPPWKSKTNQITRSL